MEMRIGVLPLPILVTLVVVLATFIYAGKLPASGLVRAVRAAGFAGGVLTGTGVILGRRTSPYAVPRFPVAPGATLVQVALAVAMRAR